MFDKDFFNWPGHNELSSREISAVTPPVQERIDVLSTIMANTMPFKPQAYGNTPSFGNTTPAHYPQEAAPVARYVNQAPQPIDPATLVKREDPDGNFSEGFGRDKLWDGKLAQVQDPSTTSREMAVKADADARRSLSLIPDIKQSKILSRLVNRFDPYANIDDNQPRPVIDQVIEATTAPEIGLAGPTQPTNNEKYVDVLQYEAPQQAAPQTEAVANMMDDDSVARQQRIEAARQQVSHEWDYNNEAQKQPSQDRYELAG